jgi:hypothetical protein
VYQDQHTAADNEKCEPQDRQWPAQKCDNCQMKGLACSANETTTQERNWPPHVQPDTFDSQDIAIREAYVKLFVLVTWEFWD